jgi:aminopeptidase N
MNKLLPAIALLLAGSLGASKASAATNQRSDTADIQHIAIHLDISNLASQSIGGYTEIRFKSKVNNLSSLLLDLQRMTIDSVVSPAGTLTYQYTTPLLNVQLPATMAQGDTASLKIYYHGQPSQDPRWGGFYFNSGYAFNMGVGMGSHPHAFGRAWFPCFDNFVERSTYEFFITTNDHHTAVCNGLLQDSTTLPGNKKMWHWQLSENIPSYLANVAVSQYALLESELLTTQQTPVPFIIASAPADTNKAKISFQKVQDAFSTYEQLFGPYKWSRAGYCMVPFNAGAMEHATNISIGKDYIDGTLTYETLIAHELSHHWFGDLATCRTSQDMWLNEGFASFCEALYLESAYGRSSYMTWINDNHLNVLLNAHLDDNGYRAVSGIDSNYTYGTTVYKKGADMLHSLRSFLGDTLLFNGLKNYLYQNQYKDVSTADLGNFLSNYSGKNVTAWLTDWIDQPGFAHYSIDSVRNLPNTTGWQSNVFIRHRKHQSNHYYQNVPLTVTFYGASGQQLTKTITISDRCTQLRTDLLFEPAAVILDDNNLQSDATTQQWATVKSIGQQALNYAKASIVTQQLSSGDSARIHVAHHWVAADRFKQAGNDYYLSPTRYWSVQGIFPASGFAAQLWLPFSANPVTNGKLDDWMNNREDSLRVFYRKDAGQEWQPVQDSIIFNVNHNDKNGTMVVKNLQAGDYTIGIKKVGFNDTTTNDIPATPCTLTTTGIKTWEMGKSSLLEMYPNPVHHQLQIILPKVPTGNVLMKVTDVQGRLITKQWLQNAQQRQFTADTSAWPQGLLQVQLFTTGGESIGYARVLVQH